jgi:hypothetical protein
MACEKRNKFASISRNLIQSTTQQMVQFTQPQIPQQVTTQRFVPQQMQQQQSGQMVPQQQQMMPQQQFQPTQQMTIQPVQQPQQPTQSSGMNEGFQTFQSSNTVVQPASEASQVSGSSPLSSKCGSITIRNSMVSIVNGAYNQISQGMYKRSDDLRLPGLVASIRNQWCISYSFTLSDLERMNQATFNTACTNLDCCILISDSNPILDIADQKRQWKINLLENKGQVDQNIKIECDDVSKGIKCLILYQNNRSCSH